MLQILLTPTATELMRQYAIDYFEAPRMCGCRNGHCGLYSYNHLGIPPPPKVRRFPIFVYDKAYELNMALAIPAAFHHEAQLAAPHDRSNSYGFPTMAVHGVERQGPLLDLMEPDQAWNRRRRGAVKSETNAAACHDLVVHPYQSS